MKKLFFLLLVAFGIVTFNSFCTLSDSIKGNGKKITKEISGLSDFDAIASGISGDIEITRGDKFEVIYEGDENILKALEIEVENHSLNIETKKTAWNWGTQEAVKFRVTMPSLKKIALGGSGTIVTTNEFEEEKISIAVGGSGDVRVKGKATKQSIAIGGSGTVDASNLDGEEASVAIGGSGDAKMAVSNKLSVSIGGSGDVTYRGNPTVKKSIAGSGDVRKID